MTTISNIDIKIKTGDLSSAIKLTRDLGSTAASTEKVLTNLASADFSKIPISLKAISVALVDVRKNAIQAKNAINDLAAATKASSSAGSLLQASARSSTTAINSQAVAVQRLIDNLRKLNTQANNTNMTPKGSGRRQSAPSTSNAPASSSALSSLSSSASSSGNAASMAAAGFRALSGALGPVGIAAGVVVSALVSMIGPMREADKYSAMMSRGFATIGVSGQQAQSTLVDVANKAGVAYQDIARAYLSYSVAANEAGTTNQQATRTFSAVTMAINRTGGSSEQAQRALLALSQMMSKGTVMSEELKGQLGEALPGAVSAGARAMKMDVATFLKEVGDGKVVAKDFVDALTGELERANKATAGMSDNFSANMTKMGNSIGNMTLRLMTATAEATNTMLALQKMAAWMDKVDKGDAAFTQTVSSMHAAGRKNSRDETEFGKQFKTTYAAEMTKQGKGTGVEAQAANIVASALNRKQGISSDDTYFRKVAGDLKWALTDAMAKKNEPLVKALTARIDAYNNGMSKGLAGYQKDQTAKKEKQEVDDATNNIGRDKAIKDAGIIRRNNPIEKAQNALEDWDKATAALIKGKTGTERERIKAQRDAGRAELEVKKKNAEESAGKKSSRSSGTTGTTVTKQERVENTYKNIKTDIEQNKGISDVGIFSQESLDIAGEITKQASVYIDTMRSQYDAGQLSLAQYREQYAVQQQIIATADKEADIRTKYMQASDNYVEAQQKILDNTIQKIDSDERLKALTAAQAAELRKQAQAQYDTNIAANKTALAQREAAEITKLQVSRQDDVNKSLDAQATKLDKIISKHRSVLAAAEQADRDKINKFREENDVNREPDIGGRNKRRSAMVDEQSSNALSAYQSASGAVQAQQDNIDDGNNSPAELDKLARLIAEADRAKAALDAVRNSAAQAFDEIDAKQNSVAGGIKEGYLQYLESMPTFADHAKQSIAGLADAFGQFSQGFEAGEQAVKQWASTMLQQIAAVIIKSLALAAIQAATGTGGGGGFGADFMANMKGGFGITQAKGGAWDKGIKKFAKGGAFTNSVVDKPTGFAYSAGMGLMGEAGPEAIMPLKRGSDGSLGVRVSMPVPNQQPMQQYSSTSSSPIFNITVNTSVESDSEEAKDPKKLSDMISQRVKTEVSKAMTQAQRPGGAMYGR